MIAIRNHRNYFGLTKPELAEAKNNSGLVTQNPFILITSINLYDWKIDWTYDVFWSAEHFNNGGNPITDFRRPFWLEVEAFQEFREQHSALFVELDNRFRQMATPQPSVAAKFVSAKFDILGFRLDIEFEDGGQLPGRKLRENNYHQAIAGNLDVIGFDGIGNKGLIPLLHDAAKQKDAEFFADTELILPE